MFQEFDQVVKIFHPDGLTSHLIKDFRSKPQTRRETFRFLESIRHTRSSMSKHIDMYNHIPNEKKRQEKEIGALDIIIRILNAILQIPYQVPKIIYDKPNDCPICLNSLKDQDNPISCGHWCHKACMDDWCLQKTNNFCPICKAKNVTYIF
jgi:hypothetical protein